MGVRARSVTETRGERRMAGRRSGGDRRLHERRESTDRRQVIVTVALERRGGLDRRMEFDRRAGLDRRVIADRRHSVRPPARQPSGRERSEV